MNKIKLFFRQRWAIFVVLSAMLIVVVNPSTLFFLNDDLDSLPDYSKGVFFHKNGTRLLAELSMLMDFKLYGLHAAGYIVTNLLIHIACCAAGWHWCNKMTKSFGIHGQNAFVFPGIILFMWFAFHSEAVFWTISRTASLGLLCFFCVWFCFFKSAANRWWSAGIFLFMLGGLFSYETILLVPVQMFVWHWCMIKNGSADRKTFRLGLILSIAAIVVYMPVRRYITYEWIGTYEAKEMYAFNVFKLVKNYVSLLLRTFSPPLENKIITAAFGCFCLLVLTLMSVKIAKSNKSNGWWWFLLFNWLSGYIFFVSLGIDMGGCESERYLYVPSFFFCIWFAYSIQCLPINLSTKKVIFFFFLMFHVFFFMTALGQFRKAGDLARQILVTINKEARPSPDWTKISIENLPDKAYGVPLFRLGINNGVILFYPHTDTSTIKIRSRLEQAKKIRSDELLYTVGVNVREQTKTIRFLPTHKKGE